MKKIKWWHVVLLLLLIFLIYKFKEERVADKGLIREKVNEIIAYEKRQAQQKCKQQSLELASKVVDSLFRIWSVKTSFDTTHRPGAPVKPDRPDFKSPLENKPLKPLFDTLGKK